LIPATFTFTRTESNSGDLIVYYTQSGTSVANQNHVTITSPATIPSGQWSTTVTVTPIEVDGNKTLTVTITANAAYTISTPSSATITIQDGTPPASNLGVKPDEPGKFFLRRR
jgi:hypothetical protein